MRRSRRDFVVATVGAAAVLALPGCASRIEGETQMYGLIGKMRAAPGQRDALISILLHGVSGMPGCLSYVVAQDPSDADAVWITEVWDSATSHKASLSLPSVKDAISRGRPLIAGFDQHVETVPVGGHGIRADA
jgi:quinol monooxygenase YgiN